VAYFNALSKYLFGVIEENHEEVVSESRVYGQSIVPEVPTYLACAKPKNTQ
jgi:hypothetical protein